MTSSSSELNHLNQMLLSVERSIETLKSILQNTPGNSQARASLSQFEYSKAKYLSRIKEEKNRIQGGSWSRWQNHEFTSRSASQPVLPKVSKNQPILFPSSRFDAPNTKTQDEGLNKKIYASPRPQSQAKVRIDLLSDEKPAYFSAASTPNIAINDNFGTETPSRRISFSKVMADQPTLLSYTTTPLSRGSPLNSNSEASSLLSTKNTPPCQECINRKLSRKRNISAPLEIFKRGGMPSFDIPIEKTSSSSGNPSFFLNPSFVNQLTDRLPACSNLTFTKIPRFENLGAFLNRLTPRTQDTSFELEKLVAQFPPNKEKQEPLITPRANSVRRIRLSDS